MMIRKESSRGGRERREKERWEMAKEERRKQEGGGEEEDHEHSSGEIDRIKQWYLPSLIISCISLCLLGEQDEQQRSIERAESTSLIQKVLIQNENFGTLYKPNSSFNTL